MRTAKWSRIINLFSTAAQTGGIVGPHYTASKAGTIGLTHSYASILTNEGITVNAIAPGLIETDMLTENPLPVRPNRISVGRFNTIDEAGDVVLMFARNGYITGQTVKVNGGVHLGESAMIRSRIPTMLTA